MELGGRSNGLVQNWPVRQFHHPRLQRRLRLQLKSKKGCDYERFQRLVAEQRD